MSVADGPDGTPSSDRSGMSVALLMRGSCGGGGDPGVKINGAWYSVIVLEILSALLPPRHRAKDNGHYLR